MSATEIANLVHAFGALVLAGSGVPSLGQQSGFTGIVRDGVGLWTVALETPVRPLTGANLQDVVVQATLGSSGAVVAAAVNAAGTGISVSVRLANTLADVATVLNLTVQRLPTQN